MLQNILALEDFEEAARRVIPRPIFGYASGGAETGASMRGNREQWDAWAFVPRMAVDTTARTQKTTLFGRTYDAPFGIAPMGGTSMAAYEGDRSLYRVALQDGSMLLVSTANVARTADAFRRGEDVWLGWANDAGHELRE